MEIATIVDITTNLKIPSYQDGSRHVVTCDLAIIPLPIATKTLLTFKNLLMGLCFMGCFPGNLREGKWPIKAFDKTALWPINADGMLSGTSTMVGDGPLQRPIKRSMTITSEILRVGEGFIQKLQQGIPDGSCHATHTNAMEVL